MTFIEILVAVVLLGTAGLAVLTALTVSISGSDQHRARVDALAELEGSGAFLAREGSGLACASVAGDVAGVLQERPGSDNVRLTVNPSLTLSVTGITCSGGLPVVSLSAAHANGKATERLDVRVGGLSVIQSGNGTGGPPPDPTGACAFGAAAAAPVSIGKAGNNLAGPVTIRLGYTGNCSAASATAVLSQSVGGAPPAVTLVMQDAGTGVFEATLAADVRNWKKAVVNVAITSSPAATANTTSFTVT